MWTRNEHNDTFIYVISSVEFDANFLVCRSQIDLKLRISAGFGWKTIKNTPQTDQSKVTAKRKLYSLNHRIPQTIRQIESHPQVKQNRTKLV